MKNSRNIRKTVRFYESEIEKVNKDMKKKKITPYSDHIRQRVLE